MGAVRTLGRWGGAWTHARPNRQKRIVQANIRHVFSTLTTAEQDQLVSQTLKNNLMTLLELGAVWFGSKDRSLSMIHRVDGQERLDQAAKAGKGVILLTPHIGNWEVLGNLISLNYPATFLYQPPKLTEFEPTMIHGRTRYGAELATTDFKGVRCLLKAIKQGQVIVILPDQDAGENGVPAPFFGKPVNTMTLVNRLLRSTEAECLAVSSTRIDRDGFAIHFSDVDRAALADEDLNTACSALNHTMERVIQKAPEQYLWTYKVYKDRLNYK